MKSPGLAQNSQVGIKYIEALCGGDGIVRVRYIYDSWGNTLSVQDANGKEITDPNHMGNLNPMRYRGYYFDTEMGLYYLQSRYYDPKTCCFVNADTTDILQAKGDLYDKNLFAYCDNNPVARVDYGGEFWRIAIGAAVGAIVNGAVSAISQYATTGKIDWGTVGVNFAAGAISGALAVTSIGFAASVGINAALGGGTYMAEQAIKGEEITLNGLAASTIAGGISGAIGGKRMDAKKLSGTWKYAAKKVGRENRRANAKYATKPIAKYTTQKVAVKKTVTVSAVRFTSGILGNTAIRQVFEY